MLLEFQVSSVENWNTSPNRNSMDNKVVFRLFEKFIQ